MLISKYIKNIKGDKVIWAVVVLLSVFSILAVYSSVGMLAYQRKGGDTGYYLIKHFSILGLSIALMYATHLIPFQKFGRYSNRALLIAVFFLIIVMKFGTVIFGAQRTLRIPIIELSFQPSDFAKLALFVYLAYTLARYQTKVMDLKKVLLFMILPTVIIVGLILPSNLSTAVIVFGTSIVILFIGRVKWTYLVSVIGISVIVLASYMLIPRSEKNTDKIDRTTTWKVRILSYFGENDDAKYQLTHSKIAIAEGGLTGKGPGNSIQRSNLPQASSDFIYAIIIEEYGIPGGIIIMLLYMILLFRGLRIATKSNDIFGSILACGLSLGLVFQAMVNMGVTVGLLPVTGQPLPLMSMGGTSLLFTSIAIGIMLSVSRDIVNPELTEKKYA